MKKVLRFLKLHGVEVIEKADGFYVSEVLVDTKTMQSSTVDYRINDWTTGEALIFLGY